MSPLVLPFLTLPNAKTWPPSRGWASTLCVVRTLVVVQGRGEWDLMSPVCTAVLLSVGRGVGEGVGCCACVFLCMCKHAGMSVLVCHHAGCGVPPFCVPHRWISKGSMSQRDSTLLQPPAARSPLLQFKVLISLSAL